MIVDGSDSNTATIAGGYAEVIVAAFSQDLLLLELRRSGGVPPLTRLNCGPGSGSTPTWNPGIILFRD